MSRNEQRPDASSPAKEPAGRRRRPARVWHRWIGTVIVLPLLFVAVTGVLLNHTAELGWDAKRTDAKWVLLSYGMQLDNDPISYEAASGNFATSWDGHLFWNGEALAAQGDLIGCASVDGTSAVVLSRAIVLLAEDGSMIETLGEESLPPLPIRRAALTSIKNPRLSIEASDGTTYEFGGDLLSFTPSTAAPGSLNWQPESSTSSALREKMENSYRGEGVPWSRVLLDMHSGKFFGTAGRWIADFVVVLLIALSITGLRLVFRARRSAGANRRSQTSS